MWHAYYYWGTNIPFLAIELDSRTELNADIEFCAQLILKFKKQDNEIKAIYNG